MTRWEMFEDFLTQCVNSGQTVFNHQAVVVEFGLTGRHASELIANYLDAQRRPNATTLYVLHRTGRTTNTIWHIGARTADARGMTVQAVDDMHQRVARALEPDLARMGILNPHATRVTTAIVAVIEANLQLLAASLP